MPNKYSHESAAEVLKAAGVKTPVRINTDDVKEVDFQDKGIGGTTASYGHGHDFQTVSSSQIATFQTESLRTESFQTGSFRNFHTVPTSNFQTSPPRQASHSSTSSEAYNAQVAHWLNRELPPLPTEDPKHL